MSDLQDYSKTLKPDFSTVEPSEFITAAVKAIVLPENNQTELVCENRLPEIKIDKTFTTRVLTNLGQQRSPSNASRRQINDQAINTGQLPVITVEDTGIGIPEDVKPKMFTPLFTTKSKGQGFGLPVVKRLVEAQGGAIRFESEVGKGTKFIVTLPLTH